ncbi:MAG: hypothetical protein ACKOFW_05035, partial [Planctomycetaceae bacterium]
GLIWTSLIWTSLMWTSQPVVAAHVRTPWHDRDGGLGESFGARVVFRNDLSGGGCATVRTRLVLERTQSAVQAVVAGGSGAGPMTSEIPAH